MSRYNYTDILDTLHEKITALTNSSSPPTPIYNDVVIGESPNISLINGTLAEIFLSRVLKEGYRGLKNQGRAALVEGVIITIVPGTNEAAFKTCIDSCDFVEEFFENKKSLGLDGVLTSTPGSMNQNWRIVDVNKPRFPKTPNLCIAGATVFYVTVTKAA
jgi:hypothetical protein